MSKESIWFGLDRFGFSDKAKASIMGNMGPESNFKSNNVEDRYHRDTGRSDEFYTAAVDNGTYTRNDFMFDNRKAYGYGLCQWTYNTRKAGLYDLAKGRGLSISDEPMQLDYMWQELQTSEFSGVLAVLRSDASIREMTEKFMVDFEKPADKSQNARDYRVRYAETILAEFADKTASTAEPEPDPPMEDTPDTVYWPPRMLCLGMKGTDVQLLQSLLLCHGYKCGEGDNRGVVDIRTHNMILAFQAENKLKSDAVAGPNTFRALGVAV